jgi:MYXO-CTERM domain-containing protein
MRTSRSASMVLGSMVAAGLIVCGTAIAARAAVSIGVGSGQGDPNGTVQISVTMNSGGATVGGMQNDIVFDPALVDLAKKSDCKINPEIGDKLDACDEDPPTAPCKSLSSVLEDCPGVSNCEAGNKYFRGIIIALGNVQPIPDGVMYTCTFAVKAGSGTAILQNLNFGSSDPNGEAVTTEGCDGKVVIGAEEPTETPTATETPTDTPQEVVPTATLTPVPPTKTSTATRTTGTPGADVDDDGCQIAASGQAGAGWMLLAPLAGLLWLRRRNR